MKTAPYDVAELMCTLMAREIGDGEWVNHGASVPLSAAALALARELHAPNLDYFYLGTVFMSITPDVSNVTDLTLRPDLVHETARSMIADADIINWTLRGECDFQFLRPLQIDAFGSINVSVLGTPSAPTHRFHGIAAADAMVLVKRICLYVTAHTRKVFVDELPFRTGLGHVDGGAWRQDVGAPGGGPDVVVTPLCILDFDTPDRRARLRSTHPGVTVETVLGATGFDLVVTDDVAESRPPTDEELDVLRTKVDPLGLRDLEFKELRAAAEQRLADAQRQRQPTKE